MTDPPVQDSRTAAARAQQIWPGTVHRRDELGPIAIDESGQQLVALTRMDEKAVDGGPPCPLALVVVRDPHGRVLLGRNRWRGSFELPGGMRDEGESARAAAERELREETGLTAALVWAGAAEFELVAPERIEWAAIYVAQLVGQPEAADGELTELAWAATDARAPVGTSPLDWAIALWAHGPARGDDELSAAIVAYYRRGASSFPRTDPEAAAACATRRTGAELLRLVLGAIRDAEQVDVDWSTTSLSRAGDLVRDRARLQHPELSEHAVDTIAWAYTYAMR